ncbi:hypothetical protein BGW42_003417 [Actinomortierella wolfii]|nr:hypothetical protein BGW42_003417 [Actinomortierella wolfii]
MLRNASRSSTELFARLGHNFYIDWENEISYIMYDTADTQEGLEIPTWVVISVLAIITASALLYASSLLLDEKYSSSLYKNIAIQMAPQIGANAPMLMRAKLDPVRFEETPAVSGEQRELDGMETPLVSALYSTLGKVHEE